MSIRIAPSDPHQICEAALRGFEARTCSVIFTVILLSLIRRAMPIGDAGGLLPTPLSAKKVRRLPRSFAHPPRGTRPKEALRSGDRYPELGPFGPSS